MAIEKATITNLDSSKSFPVMFNPKEYILDKSTPWKEDPAVGGSMPKISYSSGQRRTLYMELFFDTTFEDGADRDVSKKTKEIEDLMLPSEKDEAGLPRPPFLQFAWGSFKFNCVLEDLVQKFTKFDTNGNPLRAILRVVFKEFDGGSGTANS